MDHDLIAKQVFRTRPMVDEDWKAWAEANPDKVKGRRIPSSGRLMTPEEIAYMMAPPKGKPIAGPYVQTVRSGDKDELDTLRRLAEVRGKKVEPSWDAKRLRNELGFSEDQEVRTYGGELPEQHDIADEDQPHGEGSTASGQPEIEAHPGHGITASGAVETAYDPGFGATYSGIAPFPEDEDIQKVEPPPTAPATTPPVNRDVPAVTSGGQVVPSVTVGAALNCTRGNWDNEPQSYTYQWQQDGGQIVGGGTAQYTTTVADAGKALTCTVSATNAMGTTAAPPSNAVTVTTAAQTMQRPGQQRPTPTQQPARPSAQPPAQPPAQAQRPVQPMPQRQPGQDGPQPQQQPQRTAELPRTNQPAPPLPATAGQPGRQTPPPAGAPGARPNQPPPVRPATPPQPTQRPAPQPPQQPAALRRPGAPTPATPERPSIADNCEEPPAEPADRPGHPKV